MNYLELKLYYIFAYKLPGLSAKAKELLVRVIGWLGIGISIIGVLAILGIVGRIAYSSILGLNKANLFKSNSLELLALACVLISLVGVIAGGIMLRKQRLIGWRISLYGSMLMLFFGIMIMKLVFVKIILIFLSVSNIYVCFQIREHYN